MATDDIEITRLVAQHGEQTSEVDYAVRAGGRTFSPYEALAFADDIRRTIREEDERRLDMESGLRRGERDDLIILDIEGAVDDYISGALARKAAAWRGITPGDTISSDWMPPAIVTAVGDNGLTIEWPNGYTGTIPSSLLDRFHVGRGDQR